MGVGPAEPAQRPPAPSHCPQLGGQRVAGRDGRLCPQIWWLDPELTYGNTQPFVFTQGHSVCNRSFFPCFDTPAVKSTYSAVVKVSALDPVCPARPSPHPLDSPAPPPLVPCACPPLAPSLPDQTILALTPGPLPLSIPDPGLPSQTPLTPGGWGAR